jgi:hypothetical protein
MTELQTLVREYKDGSDRALSKLYPILEPIIQSIHQQYLPRFRRIPLADDTEIVTAAHDAIMWMRPNLDPSLSDEKLKNCFYVSFRLFAIRRYADVVRTRLGRRGQYNVTIAYHTFREPEVEDYESFATMVSTDTAKAWDYVAQTEYNLDKWMLENALQTMIGINPEKETTYRHALAFVQSGHWETDTPRRRWIEKRGIDESRMCQVLAELKDVYTQITGVTK